MRSRAAFRPTYANIGATLALLLGLTGFAVAGNSGSSGVINACANKKTGELRLLGKGKCKKRERRISWSRDAQQGPTGSQGPQGPTGSDAQFNGATAEGDLSGTYPNPAIAGGAVTPGKLGTIPQARAYSSSFQSIPYDTVTALQLDSELFDTAGLHDNAPPNNTRLTAPIAGTYHVDACVAWDPNATGLRSLQIRLNGDLASASAASQIAPAPAVSTTQHCAGELVRLAAGDYVEMVVRQMNDAVGPLNAGSISSVTFLAMTWVGP